MAAFDEEFLAGLQRRAERILALSVGEFRDGVPDSDDVPGAQSPFDEEFLAGLQRRAERILALSVGEIRDGDDVQEKSESTEPTTGTPAHVRRRVRHRGHASSSSTGSRDTSSPRTGVGRAAFVDDGSLAGWLEANRTEMTRVVVGMVRGWIARSGGHVSTAAEPALRVEAESAVGMASARLLATTEQVNDWDPFRTRAVLLKSAAAMVMRDLRAAWRVPPAEFNDNIEEILFSEPTAERWITGLARGQSARPLLEALTLWARGADLPEVAAAVGRLGLDLSEGQVAVELARALRFARKGNRELARFIDGAQVRLQPALEQHLRETWHVEERLVRVVADRALCVPDSVTAESLGLSAARVRNLRHEARKLQFVREYLADDVAFGWPLDYLR